MPDESLVDAVLHGSDAELHALTCQRPRLGHLSSIYALSSRFLAKVMLSCLSLPLFRLSS